jgi:hypothetical protein
MEANSLRELLLKEMEQINEHARVLFQVYIAWLTFFITILLGGMAAAIKASVKNGRVRHPQIVYFIGALFGIQVVFGVIACIGLHAELQTMNLRIHTITANLVAVSEARTNAPPVGYILPQSSIPHVMVLAVTVGIWTLISHFLLWGFLVWRIRQWSATNKEVLGTTSG